MAEDSCSTGSSDSGSGFGASMPVAITSDRLPPADAPLIPRRCGSTRP